MTGIMGGQVNARRRVPSYSVHKEAVLVRLQQLILQGPSAIQPGQQDPSANVCRGLATAP